MERQFGILQNSLKSSKQIFLVQITNKTTEWVSELNLQQAPEAQNFYMQF